ncbi:MAG: hemolysin III family protein [Actinomycetota bacterium]|nr:hemolysin III family protein [Actinomycetota bacterium]
MTALILHSRFEFGGLHDVLTHPVYGPRPRLRGRLHHVAAIASVPAGVHLVTKATAAGSPGVALVYAITWTLMFTTSACYHRLAQSPTARFWMRRLDHSMIFVHLAGATTLVAVDLAKHLIDTAMSVGFDVAASESLPRPELGMGHAFGFPLRRLLGDVPIVPIMVNTYNPPTQPRAARCRDFGRMLRSAVDSFDADTRIGVVASGGLSHFIVLEEFDRRVLAALEAGDLDAVVAIPESTFVAGTSEVKNWLVTAAMLSDRRFELIDYVPGYRTPAGTGAGLGFGVWS